MSHGVNRKDESVPQSAEDLIVEDLEPSDSSRVKATRKKRTTEKKKKTLLWQKGRLIGSGGFGKVFLGLDGNTGTLIAGKEFNFDVKEKKQISMLQQLDSEIRLMKELQHENIVKYVGADKRANNFYIFMEYVPGGSLRSILDTYGPLKAKVASQWTRQILRGLGFLHDHKVVHRDIKCANVLVNVDGVVKLADFGSAQYFADTKGMHGTPYWMAPEVIHQKDNIGWPCDIWSLGCTVVEMMTAKTPFFDMGNSMKVMLHIAGNDAIQVPKSIHPIARDFIENCLKRDAADRPSVEKLLMHPFVYQPPRPDSRNSETSSVFMDSITSYASEGGENELTSTSTPMISDSSQEEDIAEVDPALKSVLVASAISTIDMNDGPSGPNPLRPEANKMAESVHHDQDMVETIMSIMGPVDDPIEVDLNGRSNSNQSANSTAINISDGANRAGSPTASNASQRMEVLTVSSLPPEGCTTMKKVQGLIVFLLIAVLAALSVLLALRT